ncbi:unnamed protein product, partial [Discosporangium mesarthrocarpum]
MSEIRPASSAYSLFQKDNYQKARASLEARGEDVDVGDVQREISSRWKELPPDDQERAKYESMALKDKTRYLRECEEKDREVEAIQAARRAQRDTLTTASRMRGRPPAAGEEGKGKGSSRTPKELTEEERERRRKRQEDKQRSKAKKQAREALVDKQKQKIEDEIAKQ